MLNFAQLPAQIYLLKSVAGSPRMHTYLRNKPAWMQLIIFGLLTGGIVFVASAVGISLVANFNHLSVMQIASMSPSDYARPELAGVIKGLLIVQFFGIFFLPPLVFAYLADPASPGIPGNETTSEKLIYYTRTNYHDCRVFYGSITRNCQ